MQIAKGIEGIRRHRNENRDGWHIFLDGKNDGFSVLSLNEIIAEYDGSWTLTQITGNILWIATGAN